MMHGLWCAAILAVTVAMTLITGCRGNDNHCIEKVVAKVQGSDTWGWVPLSCPEGSQFREIQFASFGSPVGKCANGVGNFKHGLCEGNTTFILQDVQNKCLNQSKCQVEIYSQYFGPSQFCSLVTTYKLVIEWICQNKTTGRDPSLSGNGKSGSDREENVVYIVIGSSGAGLLIVVVASVIACHTRSHRGPSGSKASCFESIGITNGNGREKLITMEDLTDNDCDSGSLSGQIQIPDELEKHLLKSSESDCSYWENNDAVLYGNRELRQLAKQGHIPLAMVNDPRFTATRDQTQAQSSTNRAAFAEHAEFVKRSQEMYKNKFGNINNIDSNNNDVVSSREKTIDTSDVTSDVNDVYPNFQSQFPTATAVSLDNTQILGQHIPGLPPVLKAPWRKQPQMLQASDVTSGTRSLGHSVRTPESNSATMISSPSMKNRNRAVEQLSPPTSKVKKANAVSPFPTPTDATMMPNSSATLHVHETTTTTTTVTPSAPSHRPRLPPIPNSKIAFSFNNTLS